ncbi:MAG: Xaa-Pro peptidase family protein [Clostridia bacterium]|nr:Xaa-Pro peptidase family protein [Clostridia bacterium]
MIRIPDSEFKERIIKIQAEMKKEGYTLLLAYGNEAEPQYIRYLSDYWPSFETAGVLVPQEGDALLLIGPESFTYASDRSRLREIRLLKAFRESSEPEYPGKPLDTFQSVFHELIGNTKIERFGVAGLPLMTIGVYTALQEALGEVKIEKADALVSNIRMIKTENELACMRKAAEITRGAMDYVIANMQPGMTECQVAGLALGKMHELGAERESYPVWVLTGAGSEQAISRPRHKVIEKGDLTFLQIGARYEGYASSIGRPVIIGKPTAEQENFIQAGYAAQEAVIANLRAGADAATIAKKHIEYVTNLGYGDYLLYGPCHGNGLMEGEAPWIETDSTYALQENMTFCVDIYLGSREKQVGLRMEDVVRITKDGAENLTNYKKELFII